MIIDLGFGTESAEPRTQAIDRAELLVSLAALVGAGAAPSPPAVRAIGPHELATAAPYLQPLALSAATRKQASKTLLQRAARRHRRRDRRGARAARALVRVRPRTLVMIAALDGAFYVLLPQLADVGDSVDALGSANLAWLAVCVVMSLVTYVGAAIGMAGGVPEHLPFGPNLAAQLASSFVNRVTPANVGGMALNVRFLQKAGVAPAEAVTGIGLNVARRRRSCTWCCSSCSCAWAGQSDTNSFQIPSSSKLLVVIAVVLAVDRARGRAPAGAGGCSAPTCCASSSSRGQSWWCWRTRRRRSPPWSAARSLISLAYIGALAAAVAAFDGGVSFAQVGAVYLGASVIAAAAPTPGGLGAMEAALVAGLHRRRAWSRVVAVAAVLSYRLLTYWLPILPGWLSFHYLERRDFI